MTEIDMPGTLVAGSAGSITTTTVEEIAIAVITTATTIAGMGTATTTTVGEIAIAVIMTTTAIAGVGTATTATGDVRRGEAQPFAV